MGSEMSWTPRSAGIAVGTGRLPLAADSLRGTRHGPQPPPAAVPLPPLSRLLRVEEPASGPALTSRKDQRLRPSETAVNVSERSPTTQAPRGACREDGKSGRAA